ncbi:MAG: YceD family protein [Pseudomonadota bacterium]
MSRIPVSIDPWQPRARDHDFEGDLQAKELPRLREEALEGHPLQVHARFALALGSLGELRLSGAITGELWQTCQRCLQPLAWEFSLHPDAVLLPSGGPSEGLDAADEFVEVDADGRLRPLDWIEEEILLAWPLAPRHEHCEPAAPATEFVPGEGRDNPFAELEQLKGRLKGSTPDDEGPGN